MHIVHQNRFRSPTIIFALACCAAVILSGCGGKKQAQDPAKLVAEIDSEISRLAENYKAAKSAAPELRASILEAAEPDAAALSEARAKVGKIVSGSEDAVALVDGSLLKLEEMEEGDDYKAYVEKEKKAQETRKKAWAEVKVWWDAYESALQAAGSLYETGTFMAEEFPPEFEGAMALLQEEDWQGAKDAFNAISPQMRTQTEALTEALEELEIESAAAMTDALDLFDSMIRLSIEFCEAGIAGDEMRQHEISFDIESTGAALEALAIDTDAVGAEIKAQLRARGADFDFAKSDKLMGEAEELEAVAQAAKPKGTKK